MGWMAGLHLIPHFPSIGVQLTCSNHNFMHFMCDHDSPFSMVVPKIGSLFLSPPIVIERSGESSVVPGREVGTQGYWNYWRNARHRKHSVALIRDLLS
jgi:hypothetical protein